MGGNGLLLVFADRTFAGSLRDYDNHVSQILSYESMHARNSMGKGAVGIRL